MNDHLFSTVINKMGLTDMAAFCQINGRFSDYRKDVWFFGLLTRPGQEEPARELQKCTGLLEIRWQRTEAGISASPKFLYSGPLKWPEYLFLYFLVQSGCDVLFLVEQNRFCLDEKWKNLAMIRPFQEYTILSAIWPCCGSTAAAIRSR